MFHEKNYICPHCKSLTNKRSTRCPSCQANYSEPLVNERTTCLGWGCGTIVFIIVGGYLMIGFFKWYLDDDSKKEVTQSPNKKFVVYHQSNSNEKHTPIVGTSCYMKTSNDKGYIWNGYYEKDDIAEWRGRYDDRGYASGDGILYWKKKSQPSKYKKIEGRLINGKFHGKGSFQDSDYNLANGYYENGKRIGIWYYKNTATGKEWSHSYK